MSANPEPRRLPTRELEAEPKGDAVRGRSTNAMADRREAHERWIGGDEDDPACRGID